MVLALFKRLIAGQDGNVRLISTRRDGDKFVVDLSAISAHKLNVGGQEDGPRFGVVHVDGSYRAFDMQCPHLGGDLAKGCYRPADVTLQCPWHGYLYSMIDGRLIGNPNESSLRAARIPCRHFDPDKKPKYKLRNYDTNVVSDKLYLTLK